MKWQKSLMMILVLLTAVGARFDYIYGEAYSEEIPGSSDIKILYEGNDQHKSNDFYRVAIYYTQASTDKREIPESLVIYEKDLGSGNKVAVHTVNFGDNAGKPLKEGTDKSYLEGYNAFYYRKFTVKKNPNGTEYEYTCEITFPEKNNGDIKREEITKTSSNSMVVTVSNPLKTELLTVGTFNMFGAIDAVREKYTLKDKMIEQNFEKKEAENKDIWPMDIEFPGQRVTIHNNEAKMFVSNASLETHVMYKGDRLASDKQVKFMLYSNYTETNSMALETEKEVPAISRYLTELAKKKQTDGMHNKEHFEVFMGMGSGPQGSILTDEDNPNDVAYLFATNKGNAHSNFDIKITDEMGNHVPGFVFDYINIRYNPVVLGSAEVGGGDAYVKPLGYLMLNSEFKNTGEIPEPKMTLDMKELLKDEEIKKLIAFDESNIKLYIAEDGQNFKESDLCKFTLDNNKVMTVDIPKEYLATEEIIYFKEGEYKIKLTIPTKFASSYTTSAYKDLIAEKNKYPIYLKVIMNDPMFEDRPELQTRVDIKYDITLYKMPGIN